MKKYFTALWYFRLAAVGTPIILYSLLRGGLVLYPLVWVVWLVYIVFMLYLTALVLYVMFGCDRGSSRVM